MVGGQVVVVWERSGGRDCGVLRQLEVLAQRADCRFGARSALTAAATGEDPFVLEESTIKIVFDVTAAGDIAIGVNGTLGDELIQALSLPLVLA